LSLADPEDCLLHKLLTTKTLPTDFVRSEWLEWAERNQKSIQNISWFHSGMMDCFMKNVDAPLMVPYPADAKFIAENAGNKIAAATWLCKIMTAGQNRHTKTRNRP